MSEGGSEFSPLACPRVQNELERLLMVYHSHFVIVIVIVFSILNVLFIFYVIVAAVIIVNGNF